MAKHGKPDQEELPVSSSPQLSQGFAPPPVPTPIVVVAGAQCPECRTGMLYEDWAKNGACLACICFPIGTICCAGPQVVIVGGCPTCRTGVLSDEFTCCGIFLAILFFPIGILCCWMMRTKKCSNCGATFD